MRSGYGRIWIAFLMLAALAASGSAETYHLTADKGWQNVAEDPEGEYLLAVSKIKLQLLTGTRSDVVKALKQLKRDFPELAGAQIDAYLKAEKRYAKGKWYKAAVEYKKFIDTWPDSILQPAALERIYSIGTGYLQGQKRVYFGILRLPAFDTGAELMRDIADRAGNSSISLRALTTLAENQERKKQYKDAYFTWQEIFDRWPTGETRKTSLLRMAQVLHASYDGTEYDASVIDSARSYFQDYNAQYPDDAARLKVPETVHTINEQMAYKEYQTGFYYERTGQSSAANRYYQNVVSSWPDSEAAKMANARLAPDAVPPIKMNVRRRTVGGVSRFLDNWFGLKPLYKSVKKSESKE
jgi:outer membrane protein assembly factor BamD (BamD/ComL family)